LAENKEAKFHYGGQAVMEGVMMRGPKDFAVAVRRANGEIVSTVENVESMFSKLQWLRKPFLRGTLMLIDSMALGIKALKYSADIGMQDIADSDPKAKAKAEADTDNADPTQTQAEPKKSVNDMTISIMMVLGLVVGVAFFVLVPSFIAKRVGHSLSGWERTAFAGVFKIALFFAYVSLISLMKDIRRVFQYHGAEHKTINAYEAGEELTVENVSKYTKVHVRCGTSFILVVLLVSIIVMMPFGWKNLLVRYMYELLLLPVVAGLSYEVIRFAGSRKDSVFTKIILAPGLFMQKITTREPEPQMIEVAIASLRGVLEKESLAGEGTE